MVARARNMCDMHYARWRKHGDPYGPVGDRPGGQTWKPVVGYEGLYEISNEGNVWSHKTKSILRPQGAPGHYVHVNLCKNGHKKQIRVHTLVLEIFVGKPLPRQECNHKNGVKTDNRLQNLEWCTHGENEKHAYATGLKKSKPPMLWGEGVGNSKLKAHQVREIWRLHETKACSQAQMARIFGVSDATISMIIHGINWRRLPKAR